MARAQLRAAARRQGIPLVDPLGRELSDVELQLELDDSPQGQMLKRQLKGMNPQRRAEALRTPNWPRPTPIRPRRAYAREPAGAAAAGLLRPAADPPAAHPPQLEEAAPSV